MDPDLEKTLKFDPFGEAETQTGGRSQESDSLGLLLHLANNEQKKALLFLNGDTSSWDQTSKEWIDVILSLGFQLVLTEPIKETGDKIRIFWRDGIILFTDSYLGDKTINTACAYFNYAGERDAMYGCSSQLIEDPQGKKCWAANLDAREGFKSRLKEIEEKGKFLSQWEERPFLWFLSHQDTKTEGYDYEALTETRIKKLPEEIQKAITPQKQPTQPGASPRGSSAGSI